LFQVRPGEEPIARKNYSLGLIFVACNCDLQSADRQKGADSIEHFCLPTNCARVL